MTLSPAEQAELEKRLKPIGAKVTSGNPQLKAFYDKIKATRGEILIASKTRRAAQTERAGDSKGREPAIRFERPARTTMRHSGEGLGMTDELKPSKSETASKSSSSSRCRMSPSGTLFLVAALHQHRQHRRALLSSAIRSSGPRKR